MGASLFILALVLYAICVWVFYLFLVKPLIKAKNIVNDKSFWTTFFFGVVISLMYYGFMPDNTDLK